MVVIRRETNSDERDSFALTHATISRHVDSTMNDEDGKYYEDYLKKKEGKKKWAEFWVVLQNNWLIFYSNRDTANKDNYRGYIDVTVGSKCVTGKRKTYSFPFILMTKKGKHLFKCDSTVQRHKWMYALGLVSKRSPPTVIPSNVLTNRTQTEDGVYVGNWNMSDCPDKNDNSDDDDDSEDDGVISDDDDNDDEDDVIPPRILIVSESTGRVDEDIETVRSSSFADFCALNTTGLGGITVVSPVKDQRPKVVSPTTIQAQQTSLHPLQKRIQSTPRLGRTSWTSLDEARPRTSPDVARSTSRFLSASRDVRPNSSPEMGSKKKLARDALGTPLFTKPSAQLNVCFSRHLVKSAPNLNMQVEEL